MTFKTPPDCGFDASIKKGSKKIGSTTFSNFQCNFDQKKCLYCKKNGAIFLFGANKGFVSLIFEKYETIST